MMEVYAFYTFMDVSKLWKQLKYLNIKVIAHPVEIDQNSLNVCMFVFVFSKQNVKMFWLEQGLHNFFCLHSFR